MLGLRDGELGGLTGGADCTAGSVSAAAKEGTSGSVSAAGRTSAFCA